MFTFTISLKHLISFIVPSRIESLSIRQHPFINEHHTINKRLARKLKRITSFSNLLKNHIVASNFFPLSEIFIPISIKKIKKYIDNQSLKLFAVHSNNGTTTGTSLIIHHKKGNNLVSNPLSPLQVTNEHLHAFHCAIFKGRQTNHLLIPGKKSPGSKVADATQSTQPTGGQGSQPNVRRPHQDTIYGGKISPLRWLTQLPSNKTASLALILLQQPFLTNSSAEVKFSILDPIRSKLDKDFYKIFILSIIFFEEIFNHFSSIN